MSENQFEDLINNRIDVHSDLGNELVSKGFLIGNSCQEYLNKMQDNVFRMKEHLFCCTTLHIFVLTNACNLQCVYCQARTGDETEYLKMNAETAQKAVDFALSSPEKELYFEFQGGEPLLNFETLKFIIEYTELHRGKKKVHYDLVSNLLCLTDEMIEVLQKYSVGIATSLDGSADVHNDNRPFPDGKASYEQVAGKIAGLRERGMNPGAIQTTTRKSLTHAKDIVDAYRLNGFDSIFIRPLTPLGSAAGNWNTIGYTPEDYLTFYKSCFEYILEINKHGSFFAEQYASIFLRKIFQNEAGGYMDLRSPCGGAIGQMAYCFDGKIYTCDEGRMLAEMGDESFLLGNVYDNQFAEAICSPVCKAMMSASYLDSIPECCDCVYSAYCGQCPAVNLALNQDVYPRHANNYKCTIHKGILDLLFSYIQKAEPWVMKTFETWVY